jgi:flagellar protein FlaJ
LITQGYIIFIVFMVIILIMQFYIVPMISGISEFDTAELGGIGGGGTIEAEEISTAFLYLLLIQGFFSGLTIGKLSEGNIKAGIKHSFALVLLAFLVSSTANLIGGVGAG